jgi:hypothetical protein
MAEYEEPSDLYPGLTWPRLGLVSKVLWDARFWVAENAAPDRGDSACGIGFRAWEHGVHAVSKAALHHYADWLSIAGSGPVFVFKIGGMPIRFCRGDTEAPLPDNYSFADPMERTLQELALGQSFNGLLRIIVEANKRGFPLGVHLAHALQGGYIMRAWKLPIGDEGTGTLSFSRPKDPVDLPQIVVKTRAEIEAEAAKAKEADAKAKRFAIGDKTPKKE